MAYRGPGIQFWRRACRSASSRATVFSEDSPPYAPRSCLAFAASRGPRGSGRSSAANGEPRESFARAALREAAEEACGDGGHDFLRRVTGIDRLLGPYEAKRRIPLAASSSALAS